MDLKLAWFVEKRYTAKAFCKNWGCERVKLDGTAPNGIPLDLELYDQAMTDRELERRLRCSLCGTREIQLRTYAPPTNYQRAVSAWTPDPDYKPPPPRDPSSAVEYQWHGKRGRSRRKRR